MNTAGRVYLFASAVILTAMVDRVGWIDWPAVGHAILLPAVLMVAGAITLVFLAVPLSPVLAVITAAAFGLAKLMSNDQRL